jgi:hypothetical protein
MHQLGVSGGFTYAAPVGSQLPCRIKKRCVRNFKDLLVFKIHIAVRPLIVDV